MVCYIFQMSTSSIFIGLPFRDHSPRHTTCHIGCRLGSNKTTNCWTIFIMKWYCQKGWSTLCSVYWQLSPQTILRDFIKNLMKLSKWATLAHSLREQWEGTTVFAAHLNQRWFYHTALVQSWQDSTSVIVTSTQSTKEHWSCSEDDWPRNLAAPMHTMFCRLATLGANLCAIQQSWHLHPSRHFFLHVHCQWKSAGLHCPMFQRFPRKFPNTATRVRVHDDYCRAVMSPSNGLSLPKMSCIRQLPTFCWP